MKVELIKPSKSPFDFGYYRRTYGVKCVLIHYLLYGARLGYKPHPKFDPVAYSKKYSFIPLSMAFWFWLCLGKFFPCPASLLEFWQGLTIHDKINGQTRRNKELKDRNLFASENQKVGDTLNAAENFTKPRVYSFEVKGQEYRVHVTKASDFLSRIETNEPFTITRLPHGYWDSYNLVFDVAKQLVNIDDYFAKDFDLAFRVACRIGLEKFGSRSSYVENYIQDVGRVIANLPESSNYYLSVAFKGFPQGDKDGLCGYEDTLTEVDKERLSLMAKHISNERFLLDAMMWKRWVINGEAKDLPKILKDHPVIMIGPHFFNSLGKRWKLDYYQHISIPPIMTTEVRRVLLRECQSIVDHAKQYAIQNNKKQPFIMTQCSGPLALWILTHLHSNDAGNFYIDMGQAINAWFIDRKESLKRQWISDLFWKKIIKNCELEGYYRNILGENYEKFFMKLNANEQFRRNERYAEFSQGLRASRKGKL